MTEPTKTNDAPANAPDSTAGVPPAAQPATPPAVPDPDPVMTIPDSGMYRASAPSFLDEPAPDSPEGDPPADPTKAAPDATAPDSGAAAEPTTEGSDGPTPDPAPAAAEPVESLAGSEEAQKLLQARIDQIEQGQSQLAKREGDLERQRAELKDTTAQAEQYAALGQSFRDDPVGTLQQLANMAGVKESGYDYATRAAINGGAITGDQKTANAETDQDRKIRELEEKIEASSKATQIREAEQRIESFHQEIDKHVATNREDLEVVHGLGREQAVYQIIDQHYVESQGKELLTIDKAAQMAETQLATEAVDLVTKLLALPKTREILAPLFAGLPAGETPAAPAPGTNGASDQADRRPPDAPGPRSLNNQQDAAPPARQAPPAYIDDREQSLREASKLLAFRDEDDVL